MRSSSGAAALVGSASFSPATAPRGDQTRTPYGDLNDWFELSSTKN